MCEDVMCEDVMCEVYGPSLYPSPYMAMDIMGEDHYIPSYVCVTAEDARIGWTAPNQNVHVVGIGIIFYGAGVVPNCLF